MLLTAVAAAVTSGLAVLASGSTAASVALLFVLAFGAGLMLTAGPSATQVGMAAVAAALVLGHLRKPGVDRAARRAAGVRRRGRADGARDRGLAAAAGTVPNGSPSPGCTARSPRPHELRAGTGAAPPAGRRARPPSAAPSTGSATTTARAWRRIGCCSTRPSGIRREILVVTAAAERLTDEDDPILAGLVRGGLTATGDVLAELADALAAARPVDDAPLRRGPGRPAARRRAARGRRRTCRSPGVRPPRGCARCPVSCGRRSRTPAPARARGASGDPVRSSGAAGAAGSGRRAAREPAPVRRGAPARRPARSARGRHRSGRARCRDRPRVLGVAHRPGRAASGLRHDVAALGHAHDRDDRRPARGHRPAALRARRRLVAGRAHRGVLRSACGSRGRATSRCRAVGLSALVVVLLAIQGTPAHTTFASRAVATWCGGRWRLPRRSRCRCGSARRAPAAGRAARRLPAPTSRALADPAAVPGASSGCAPTRGGPVPTRRPRSTARRPNRWSGRRRWSSAGPSWPTPTGWSTPRSTRCARRARPATGRRRAPFLAAAGAALGPRRGAVRSGAAPTPGPRLRPAVASELAASARGGRRRGGGRRAIRDAADRITNSIDTLLAELRRQRAPRSARATRRPAALERPRRARPGSRRPGARPAALGADPEGDQGQRGEQEDRRRPERGVGGRRRRRASSARRRAVRPGRRRRRSSWPCRRRSPGRPGRASRRPAA